MGNNGFMGKYLKKAWNDPVGSKLISAGIISGLGYLGIWMFNISLEEIWANNSQAIITSGVFIFIGGVVFLIYWIKSKKTPFLKETKTHEKICGYHWSWQWKYSPEKKKYEIEDLYPVCPKCGTNMRITDDYSSYKCHNNHKIKNSPEDWFLVNDIILQKIKDKYPKYSDKII